MKKSAACAVAFSAVALGVTAFVAGAPAASADPVTGGASTITVPVGTEVALAKAGIVEIPLSPASAGYDDAAQTVTETFPVTGGTARVSTLTGHLDHSGGLLVVNYKTGKSVQLGSLVFDLFRDQLTAVPSGASAPVALFDARGTRSVHRDGDNNSFSATDLQVDAAGAAYLDDALGTSYFVAGQSAGSFAANWVYSTS
ncbi:MAG TPA: hypothetical protein VGL39_22500 [Jatrophihabitantaceae bacterium]|jgi:hypothetical protein